MTLLAMLIVAVLPLVSGGVSGASSQMDHVAVMSAENCAHDVTGHVDGAGCGVTMHCMMLVMPEKQMPVRSVTVAAVHQRISEPVPNGMVPESTSPPPRS